MRFWISGPRIMGIRPGVSFGREDFAGRKSTFREAGKPIGQDFVYVVRGDHGQCKIGVTSNPIARIASLRTCSPFPISFAFIGAVDKNAALVEREAHRLLNDRRGQGEWFDTAPELAIAALWGATARLNDKLKLCPWWQSFHRNRA